MDSRIDVVDISWPAAFLIGVEHQDAPDPQPKRVSSIVSIWRAGDLGR